MTVIRTLDLRSSNLTETEIGVVLPRAALDTSEAVKIAAPVIAAVREFGLQKLRELTLEIDGFDPEPVRVSKQEIDKAVSNLDGELRKALELAIERNRRVSEAALPKDFEVNFGNASTVVQRYVPVDTVGLYAPGGKAVYPSSVIMNVVPAQVAGVRNINLASPGQKAFDGRPHPTVLAVAGLLEVENLFCMGGPSAIAAFAYGIPELSLPAVRLIAGPGNSYVAAAKRLVSSDVAIDAEAGTTEILIIADEGANPKFIAADLISQAEHDPNAAALLLTDSQQLAETVAAELSLQLNETKHSERVRKSLSGQQSAIVLVRDLDQAIEIANGYATEHLEIMVSEPKGLIQRISNAGAIFVGNYSPVSLGDYLAGSSHVLPTGSTAKFRSGLGVHTFLRPQQIIEYSAEGLSEVSKKLPLIAEAEDLPAHGEAVAKRFE